VLGVDTRSVTFTAIQAAGSVPRPLHVMKPGRRFACVHRQGHAFFQWKLVQCGVAPGNGTATAAASASLTVSVAPGGLVPGTYSGTVTIAGAGSNVGILGKPIGDLVKSPAPQRAVNQHYRGHGLVLPGTRHHGGERPVGLYTRHSPGYTKVTFIRWIPRTTSLSGSRRPGC
jgi:hypothetical protein